MAWLASLTLAVQRNPDNAFALRVIYRIRFTTVCRVFRQIATSGSSENACGGADPAPTVFVKGARYDMLMQAFGGEGSTVNTPEELSAALAQGISSGRPTLIKQIRSSLADLAAGEAEVLTKDEILRSLSE